jgi:hypothetical protein
MATNLEVPADSNVDDMSIKVPKVIAESNAGLILIAVLLLFIIMYVLIYVYKLYRRTSLKTTTFLKKPISIPYGTEKISKDVAIPRNVIGQQYSISFWLYVDGIPPTSKDKFILSRGGVEFSLNKKNSLNVSVPGASIKMEYENFPTNRWVNVILIVDENLASLYIDGKFSEAKPGNFRAVTGDVIIGKPNFKDKLDGYMSKVQLFNYSLTIDHAKIIYKAGPLHKSILSMIGIPMYGLRNPFVRLDEVNVE